MSLEIKNSRQIANTNVRVRESLRRKTVVNFKPLGFEKTDQESYMLMKFLMKTFKHVEKNKILNLVDAISKKTYNVGDNIIRHGDEGQDFFILAKGKCFVTVFEADTRLQERTTKIAFNKTLNAEHQMIGFGEISLFYNIKRTASVSASSHCEMWKLPRDVFQ